MQFTQSSQLIVPMKEEHHNSVMAGIPMFEIRRFIGEHKSQNIMALFNVKTKLNTDGGRPTPIVDWLIGNNAVALMESYKNGIGVSYFPDDPWWHNRIILLNLLKMYDIAALHTRNGVIPGTVVTEQFRLLKNRIMEKIVRYRILKDGVAISDRDTHKQAEDEIDSLNMIMIQTDVRTGIAKPTPISRAQYEIIEITDYDYKPEIKKLTRNPEYRSLQYGWTECPEFQIIKKELMAEYENIDKPVEITPKDSLKNLLAGKTKEEQLETIRALLSSDDEEDSEQKKKKAPKKPKQEQHEPAEEVTA